MGRMAAQDAVPGGARHGGETAPRTVSVRFGETDAANGGRPAGSGSGEGDLGIVDIAESLSTLKAEGGCLWLGGDETVAIERVTLNQAGDAYGEHVSYPISDFLPLPEEP